MANPSLSLSDKAALQAAMRSHIDRSLVDGAFLFFETKSGRVERLKPTTAHPAIMKMGKYYVLCSDFESEDGRSVNIDFYMARAGRRYVVFAQLVDDRDVLKRLSKAGEVERVR